MRPAVKTSLPIHYSGPPAGKNSKSTVFWQRVTLHSTFPHLSRVSPHDGKDNYYPKSWFFSAADL